MQRTVPTLNLYADGVRRPRSIGEALIENAAKHPSKVCLVVWEGDRYRTITYQDLLELSQSFGAFVDTRIGPRDSRPVFIVLKHSILLHAAFLSCMLQYRVPAYLPFPTVKQDPAHYFSTHAELFRRTSPAAVITYDALVKPLKSILPEATEVIGVEEYKHQTYLDISSFKVEEDDVALLQHSSGTTGLKKGVQLTHAEIALQTAMYAQTIEFDCSSIVASWLPLYHDMGLFTSFLMPIMSGATIVSLDAFEWVRNPKLLLKVIELFHCTHCWLPNFAFHHILNTTSPDEAFDLNSLKTLITCSEPPKVDTISKFAARFRGSGIGSDKLQACYAMAETAFAVSQSPMHAKNRIMSVDAEALKVGKVAAGNLSNASVELVSNGPAIPGIEVGVRSDDTGLVELRNSNFVGEIVVRGPFVFKGYHLNSEATKEAFVGEWYRTGDQGFLSDGDVFICGRRKELIIVHGRNYYVHDIEEVISALPHVVPGRVVAIGVDSEESGSEEAIVLVETDIEPTSENMSEIERNLRRAIKQAVFDRLELTLLSVEFVPKAWLMKTTSGKLSRSENLKRFRELTGKLEDKHGARSN